ncbi:uncharacterized protein DS421_18g620300 [Arachis hypogaea]|nr:uncharacterized protein DS421_18g620300 [Arachis hypogaea]
MSSCDTRRYQSLPPAPLFSGLCQHRRGPIRHSLPVSAHLPASLLGSFSPSFILSISVLSSLFESSSAPWCSVSSFILHFQSSNGASTSG